jgi:hypothetical protein
MAFDFDASALLILRKYDRQQQEEMSFMIAYQVGLMMSGKLQPPKNLFADQ